MRAFLFFVVIAVVLGGVLMIGRTQPSKVEGHSEEHIATQSQQKITDEMEIRRVVDEIDNAVDAKDWTTCRKYFTDAINVDFTSLAGGQPARIKADELVNGWRTNLYSEKKSHHQRSNHRITINENKAEVFSKGYAFNLLKGRSGGDLWEVWGDYRHTMERTAQGWKVSGMTLTVTHQRGNDEVRTFVPKQ